VKAHCCEAKLYYRNDTVVFEQCIRGRSDEKTDMMKRVS